MTLKKENAHTRLEVVCTVQISNVHSQCQKSGVRTPTERQNQLSGDTLIRRQKLAHSGYDSAGTDLYGSSA
jgi:hypothetical protein